MSAPSRKRDAVAEQPAEEPFVERIRLVRVYAPRPQRPPNGPPMLYIEIPFEGSLHGGFHGTPPTSVRQPA